MFSHKALQFFKETQESDLERSERVSLLRFLTEFKKVKIIDVDDGGWSIDTYADLAKANCLKKDTTCD